MNQKYDSWCIREFHAVCLINLPHYILPFTNLASSFSSPLIIHPIKKWFFNLKKKILYCDPQEGGGGRITYIIDSGGISESV